MKNFNQPLPAVQTFIEQHMDARISNLTPIERGAWSSAYVFHASEQDYVVRFSPHDEDLKKDQFATRFASAQLPIPQITQLGEAFGGYYAISEKAEGIMIDDLDQAQMRLTVPAVLALLDALRTVDLSATSGFGGWNDRGQGSHASWRDYLLELPHNNANSRLHGWRDKLAASSLGTADFDTIYQHLASLVTVCPEDRHLIHADLLHYNLLIQDHQVSAVIDWGCAKYGDYLYELAWFTFWAPWHTSMRGIDCRQLAAQHYAEIGLNVPHFAERLQCCELHIALDSIAYCVFVEQWETAEQITQQALAIVHHAG